MKNSSVSAEFFIWRVNEPQNQILGLHDEEFALQSVNN